MPRKKTTYIVIATYRDGMKKEIEYCYSKQCAGILSMLAKNRNVDILFTEIVEKEQAIAFKNTQVCY